MIINKDNINWENIQTGVDKYSWIIKFVESAKLNGIDLAKEIEFKKKFNGFYRIRQKSEKFYNFYYFLFNSKLKTYINFEDILEQLYQVDKKFESSFSSKLLHSVNPSLPIWDSIVLKKLQLKIPYQKNLKKNEKKEMIVELYRNISIFYENFLKTKEGKDLLELFDSKIQERGYKISSIKKIDFIIWQTR